MVYVFLSQSFKTLIKIREGFCLKRKIPNFNPRVGIWNLNIVISLKVYFPLFASLMYFSKAMVIEGVSGVGARMSILKP